MGKLHNYSDELFCKEVVKQGGDLGKAFQEVHPEIKDYASASSIARNKISNSKEIKERISEVLDGQHLSLITANKKLKQHLEARKPIVGKDGIIDYTEDWSAQDRALERLYKLHGLLGNNINIDARQVHVNSLSAISPEQQDKLEKILTDMHSLAEKLDLTKNKVEYKGTDGITDSEVLPKV